MSALKCVITVVKKGYSHKMVQKAKLIPTLGMTVVNGKGTVRPALYESLVGLTYDPSRDVIVTLIHEDYVNALKTIFVKYGQLEKMNRGILFVLDLKAYQGLESLIERSQEGLA